ncbi:MAG: hypothetical protein HW421_1206 [Ignavibacteria bacterium]|nr:hypothetical protein [Ignavibacteria bacterium]
MTGIIDLKSELKPYLNSYENILWVGQPKKGIIIQSSELIMILQGIFFCGFGILLFSIVIKAEVPIIIKIFVFVIMIMGLYFLFGRMMYDAIRRGKTIYGVTDERIIMKEGIIFKKVKSLNIRTISDIGFEEKSDGSGTIFFGTKNIFNFLTGLNWRSSMKPTPSIDKIQEVRKVYNQIIELQKKK